MSLGWGIIGIGSHADLKVAPAMKLTEEAGSWRSTAAIRDGPMPLLESHEADAAYSDLDSLLSDSRIDAVFIASPNFLHAPQTIRAAAAGKHVLAEKPMANTVTDSAAMVSAAGITGSSSAWVSSCASTRPICGPDRSSTAVPSAASAWPTGQWGRGNRGEPEHRPRTGLREWWETPELIGDASVLMGLGVHVFDLMRFLLREEVIEVMAMTDGQITQQPLEHIATIALRMASGTIAQVMCGRMLPDTQNDLALYGSDGRFATKETVWEARLGRAELVSAAASKSDTYEYDYLANFVAELNDFRDALECDRNRPRRARMASRRRRSPPLPSSPPRLGGW